MIQTHLNAPSPSSRFRIIQWTTPKTFLPWCSNSSPKGTLLLPLFAAAVNCCSILARRSLTSEVSSCADNDVITATIDFLSQTGALRYCRLVLSILFSIHPLADVRRTVLKRHALCLATP